MSQTVDFSALVMIYEIHLCQQWTTHVQCYIILFFYPAFFCLFFWTPCLFLDFAFCLPPVSGSLLPFTVACYSPLPACWLSHVPFSFDLPDLQLEIELNFYLVSLSCAFESYDYRWTHASHSNGAQEFWLTMLISLHKANTHLFI